MLRRIALCAALALLASTPASATELARCHARQLKAVVELGRAHLACFAKHVKRRDVDLGAEVPPCRAKAEAKFLQRYARASRARQAMGLGCVLPTDALQLLAPMADFAEGVYEEVLAGSDAADVEQNRKLAKLLDRVALLLRGTLGARAKDAVLPDAAALERAQARARKRFLEASALLLAKGRRAAREPDLEGLALRVAVVEAPLATSVWYSVEGSTTWSGCQEPALNGAHVFAGSAVIETLGADAFSGFYEVQSESFLETGQLSDGAGSLAEGTFAASYLDFWSGTFYVAGTNECSSQSDPESPGSYQIECTAEDALGLICASKVHQAVAHR